MGVENPMVLRDDGMPFDDFYVVCKKCGQEHSPAEMDAELDDVCRDCVSDVMRLARYSLEDAMVPSDYRLFQRILKAYSDGVL